MAANEPLVAQEKGQIKTKVTKPSVKAKPKAKVGGVAVAKRKLASGRTVRPA